MSMQQYIRAIAGSVVLASLALGYFVSPYWYLFTAFVGANLLQCDGPTLSATYLGVDSGCLPAN